jgi:hypothetical protein
VSAPALPEYTGTLLPEHLALIENVREHRLRVGLSTERCDRPAAEAAVRRVYSTAGLTQPRLMIWMDSPLGGLEAAAGLARGSRRPATGGGSFDDQLRGVFRGVFGQLEGQLDNEVRDQLGAHLYERLRNQLGGEIDELHQQLEREVYSQLLAQLWDELDDQLREPLWCQLDPWWEANQLADRAAARPIAGLPTSDRLDALTAAIDGLGWWWPMRDAAVLTDRPTALHLESNAGRVRLHCESGPAIGYADGYEFWAWHGVHVPADLIRTGWDAARILAEPNAEVRRCAIERMGWDKFVTAAGLQQVGETVPDPGNPGNDLSLYDVPERIYGTVGVRVLLCTNGTPDRDGTTRHYGLTVPAEIDNALDAAAWGYDLTPGEYARAQRRT